MATPSLGSGIYTRDTEYHASSHIDSYHLFNMFKESKPDDMGPLDFWALSQKVEMPLYQIANFNGKNVINIDNIKGEWTYQIPIANDLPFSVEDVEPGNTEKGIDGTSFKIKLNKREFGHGDSISYDKYNGVDLHILADDIQSVGDGFIYTVQIINNDNTKFFDSSLLNPNTLWHRQSSHRGEYGERWSDINVQAGFRNFYNFVGNSDAHVHYSVSSRADLILKGGLKQDGTFPVVELWRSFDRNITGDPSIKSYNDLETKLGKSYIKKAVANGEMAVGFLPKMEEAHFNKVTNDVNNELMWGKGGRIHQDGPDDMRLSLGLWKQLDSSFKKIYTKATFTLDIFRSELFNFYNGKVSFDGPDPNRTIIVQTGLAGMRLVSAAIQKMGFGSGMVMNASDIGAITGKAMNLHFGFAFTSFTIPYLANVQFVINPSFDSVNTNDVENPIIDGYPLSSYSFIVFDVTDNVNNNIFLLQKSWDNEMKWHYQNGTMDYMGRKAGFLSVGNFNGYRVYMGMAHKAIWVKDPTKILKIVLRNPVTNGSL